MRVKSGDAQRRIDPTRLVIVRGRASDPLSLAVAANSPDSDVSSPRHVGNSAGYEKSGKPAEPTNYAKHHFGCSFNECDADSISDDCRRGHAAQTFWLLGHSQR